MEQHARRQEGKNPKFSDKKNSDDSTDKEYEDALRRGDNDRAKRLVDDRLAEYLKGHSYTRSDVAQLFGDVMHRHEEDAEAWGMLKREEWMERM